MYLRCLASIEPMHIHKPFIRHTNHLLTYQCNKNRTAEFSKTITSSLDHMATKLFHNQYMAMDSLLDRVAICEILLLMTLVLQLN